MAGRQREHGGPVDVGVEEKALNGVHEEPGEVVEEVMGSSEDGCPRRRRHVDLLQQVHLRFRHGFAGFACLGGLIFFYIIKWW